MSRRRFLVTYDISDEKRLRKIFRVLQDFGDHIQYSVFVCELSSQELVNLKRALNPVIHHRDDQVLFFALGSASVGIEMKVESMGRDFQPRCRTIVV